MLISERVSFAAVVADDFEELALIRLAAMRASLEQIGRFDPSRARERLSNSFYPEFSRFVLLDGRKVGFYTFRPLPTVYHLDHLYVDPAAQSQGIGSCVLLQLLTQSDSQQLPVQLGALRESPANRFYQRHGFRPQREDAWDIYYVRPPSPDAARGS